MPDKVTELLPCPWCGKTPAIVCPDTSYGHAMITCGDVNECQICPAAWADLNADETIEDAKRLWNTRAMDAHRPAVDEGVVADAIEHVIDVVPALDASPSHLRRLRAQLIARAAINAIIGER